MDMRQKASTWH